jgi:hypothetical protein
MHILLLRTRRCSNPEPSGIGYQCFGSIEEVKPCQQQDSCGEIEILKNAVILIRPCLWWRYMYYMKKSTHMAGPPNSFEDFLVGLAKKNCEYMENLAVDNI